LQSLNAQAQKPADEATDWKYWLVVGNAFLICVVMTCCVLLYSRLRSIRTRRSSVPYVPDVPADEAEREKLPKSASLTSSEDDEPSSHTLSEIQAGICVVPEDVAQRAVLEIDAPQPEPEPDGFWARVNESHVGVVHPWPSMAPVSGPQWKMKGDGPNIVYNDLKGRV